MYTIVLLIEKVMNEADVRLVTSLHEDVKTSFVVVLPGKADHHRLVRALDDAALGHIEQAAEDVEHPPEDADVTRRTLDASVAALQAAGVPAQGETAPGEDPLQVLKDVVERHSADEVIVLTDPHFIEEFFHRDWASRARHKVDVPVLKLFPHSTP
ncbi:MAG: indole-3-glycerol phosphate synthase [Streptomycetaceae bacterium]|nr:indole-3-glycerol phosphate synthase [Streptomycetaceae bacterium]